MCSLERKASYILQFIFNTDQKIKGLHDTTGLQMTRAINTKSPKLFQNVARICFGCEPSNHFSQQSRGEILDLHLSAVQSLLIWSFYKRFENPRVGLCLLLPWHRSLQMTTVYWTQVPRKSQSKPQLGFSKIYKETSWDWLTSRAGLTQKVRVLRFQEALCLDRMTSEWAVRVRLVIPTLKSKRWDLE